VGLNGNLIGDGRVVVGSIPGLDLPPVKTIKKIQIQAKKRHEMHLVKIGVLFFTDAF